MSEDAVVAKMNKDATARGTMRMRGIVQAIAARRHRARHSRIWLYADLMPVMRIGKSSRVIVVRGVLTKYEGLLSTQIAETVLLYFFVGLFRAEAAKNNYGIIQRLNVS
jgi:hypothetical protein